MMEPSIDYNAFSGFDSNPILSFKKNVVEK